MTVYATQQDMVDVYGEDEILVVADRDGDGSIDAAVVERALADASHEIDSYIGARYDLPLGQVPELLKSVCVDIALYRLSLSGAYLTEEKSKRYRDRVKWLVDVSTGKASLGVGEEPAAVDQHAEITGPDRRYSRKTRPI